MKKLALFAGVLALGACQSEPAEEPAPVETEEASAPVTANGSAPGVYESTLPDGTVSVATLNADGTFTLVNAEGETFDEGTWAVTDGKTCFTSSGEEGGVTCYTESAPAEDGSFTATPDEGDPEMIKPLPAEEEAPAEVAAE
jgi:hypothetical protein